MFDRGGTAGKFKEEGIQFPNRNLAGLWTSMASKEAEPYPTQHKTQWVISAGPHSVYDP